MNRMVRWSVAAIAVAWASVANAQTPGSALPSELPLYQGVAPGSEKWD
jgi:hypothetical protein